MKKYNIHFIRKRAYKATTNSNHNYSVSPNLLKRDFNATAPNTKWVGDITYIPNHTRAEAQIDISTYIEAFYNTLRPHSGIGWLAPDVFERQFYDDTAV